MTERSGTIGAALTGAHALLRGETSSPQLDAELLLVSLLKQPREYVLAHRDEPLPSRTRITFVSLVRRRAEGVPLAYLTKASEFYGRTFVVTSAVMVPRPESEALVEEALRIIGELPYLPGRPDPFDRHSERPARRSFSEGGSEESADSAGWRPIVADIGTGSGVLGISIAAETPRTRVVVTDISEAALAVARRNARKHHVARLMMFIKSDLLTEIPPDRAPQIIVANLPYVTSDELKRAPDRLETRGLTFEPPRALDGGPDGLFVFRRFFAQLKRRGSGQSAVGSRLQHLILEHSPNQRRQILELAHDALLNLKPREVSPFVTSWTQGSE